MGHSWTNRSMCLSHDEWMKNTGSELSHDFSLAALDCMWMCTGNLAIENITYQFYSKEQNDILLNETERASQ